MRLFLILFLCAMPSVVQAASIGAELRAYPAGLVPGLRGELSLESGDRLLGHVGYNATDRQDWGEHESESGGGPGVGAGWLRRVHDHWWVGARLDYWWLSIDWIEGTDSGSTEVGVLQPTLAGSYRWGSGSWEGEANLSVGGEFNVATDGEAVGEGWILLAGIGLFFDF